MPAQIICQKFIVNSALGAKFIYLFNEFNNTGKKQYLYMLELIHGWMGEEFTQGHFTALLLKNT